MLSKTIIEMINKQIALELESALLYLDFANYFEEKGLIGFGHWYNVQSNEEISHARKFIDYLHDNNAEVVLQNLTLKECECDCDLSVLHEALKHEQYITMQINNIYEEAVRIKDFRTTEFLNWFIKEQGEEERNSQEQIDRYISFCMDCGCGIFLLDKKMGERSA